MLVDADVADTEQVDAGHGGMWYGIPAGTVLLRRPLDRVEPAAALEPWVARPILPCFDAAEECGERLIQPAERLLLGTRRPAALATRVGSPDRRNLPRLMAIAGRHAAHPPRLAPLFQCGIVELAMVLQAFREQPRLAARRPQKELVRSSHLRGF